MLLPDVSTISDSTCYPNRVTSCSTPLSLSTITFAILLSPHLTVAPHFVHSPTYSHVHSVFAFCYSALASRTHTILIHLQYCHDFAFNDFSSITKLIFFITGHFCYFTNITNWLLRSTHWQILHSLERTNGEVINFVAITLCMPSNIISPSP